MSGLLYPAILVLFFPRLVAPSSTPNGLPGVARCKGYNCYDGHGGTLVETSSYGNPLPEVMAQEECFRHCVEDQRCQAYLVGSQPGESQCWLRGSVDLENCEHGSYDVIIINGRGSESQGRTALCDAASSGDNVGVTGGNDESDDGSDGFNLGGIGGGWTHEGFCEFGGEAGGTYYVTKECKHSYHLSSANALQSIAEGPYELVGLGCGHPYWQHTDANIFLYRSGLRWFVGSDKCSRDNYWAMSVGDAECPEHLDFYTKGGELVTLGPPQSFWHVFLFAVLPLLLLFLIVGLFFLLFYVHFMESGSFTTLWNVLLYVALPTAFFVLCLGILLATLYVRFKANGMLDSVWIFVVLPVLLLVIGLGVLLLFFYSRWRRPGLDSLLYRVAFVVLPIVLLVLCLGLLLVAIFVRLKAAHILDHWWNVLLDLALPLALVALIVGLLLFYCYVRETGMSDLAWRILLFVTLPILAVMLIAGLWLLFFFVRLECPLTPFWAILFFILLPLILLAAGLLLFSACCTAPPKAPPPAPPTPPPPPPPPQVEKPDPKPVTPPPPPVEKLPDKQPESNVVPTPRRGPGGYYALQEPLQPDPRFNVWPRPHFIDGGLYVRHSRTVACRCGGHDPHCSGLHGNYFDLPDTRQLF